MTRVPRTPSEIRGLINLRGHIVTAIGMRERLGLQVADEQEAQMNLIVTLSDCAASLIVDSVGDVIDVDAHSYKPRPSTLADPLSGMVLGVYQTLNGNGLLLHIDPEAVCHFLSSNQEVSHEQ
jgi:purine-binding chemotaxis protein CheW